MSFLHLLSLFFFFTIPRPPSSTLFPYTTLFRSLDTGLSRTGLDLDWARNVGIVPGPEPGEQHAPAASTAVVDTIDRKSTRLNSSHTVISYAVFCLKKKKKKTKRE